MDELIKEIHENAKAHGWWDDERSLGEIISLIHSELSKALEEYRDRKPLMYWNKNNSPCTDFKNDEGNSWSYNGDKPEGIAVELADVIIRILDYFGKMECTIDEIESPGVLYKLENPNFPCFITQMHALVTNAWIHRGDTDEDSDQYADEANDTMWWLSETVASIFDWCKHNGIDMYEAIRIKHEYNKTRPFKHGGKAI